MADDWELADAINYIRTLTWRNYPKQPNWPHDGVVAVNEGEMPQPKQHEESEQSPEADNPVSAIEQYLHDSISAHTNLLQQPSTTPDAKAEMTHSSKGKKSKKRPASESYVCAMKQYLPNNIINTS